MTENMSGPDEANDTSRPIRLLLVEDTAADAELIIRELRRHALLAEVTRVEKEPEFRHHLALAPDIILSDYDLPEFDGVTALRIKQETAPDIPFIFVSGAIGEERAILALKDGASDYVIKDRLSRLGPAVERALAEREETRRKTTAEKELQKEREFLAVLLDNLEEGIVACDADGNLRLFNDASRKFHGLPVEPIPPEEWSRHYDLYQSDGETPLSVDDIPLVRAFRGEAVRGAEIVIKPSGLPKRTLRTSGQRLIGVQGENIGAVVAMQDITQELAASRALAELMHRHQLILDSAGNGIVGIDRQGRATFANPAASRMTGWALEEIVNAGFHDLLHRSRADSTPYPVSECPMLQTLLDGRERTSVDEVLWKKNGEAFPVEFTSSPIFESGQIAGCVVTFVDITERRHLELALSQANRLNGLGRVAATIAHEINNVMMGISPFAEVIRKKGKDDEGLLRCADQILNSVARGKQITGEILRYTQRAEPVVQRVVLTKWLNDFIAETQAVVGEKIHFQLEFPTEELTIVCDPSQLQQVLSNLIGNARDAMPEGGSIGLDFLRPRAGQMFPFGFVPNPEKYVKITVRDSGSGMPPKVLENIFEPLFTTKRTGTGLGLAIALKIIDSHHGFIFAESQLGKGTAFHIFLPLDAGGDSGKAQKTESRRRLLLVEDDLRFAVSLAELLEQEKAEVKIVQRGEDALAAVLDFHPDAVLIDIALRGMDGIDLYQLIAAHSPALPMIFSSGSDKATITARLGGTNAPYLQKPYNLEELLRALDEVLGPPSAGSSQGGP